MPSQQEIRQRITGQIIQALTSGNLPPWRQPWRNDPNCGSARSLSTLREYRGINVLLLGCAPYQSRWWGTFQAIKHAGGYVRRGEKATHIILFRPVTKTVITATGEEEEETFPIMRTIPVFNVQQTAGLEHFWPGRTELAPAVMDDRYEKADSVIVEATKMDIRFGGNAAAFSPTGNYVTMPFRHQFGNVADYYETLAHEAIHWTGHVSRLNRSRNRRDDRFGYAFEELVAEIGGYFLCAQLGLPNADSVSDNHQAYLKFWLEAMQSDPSFIFQASSQASKAVGFIMAFSQPAVEEPAVEEPEEVLAA